MSTTGKSWPRAHAKKRQLPKKNFGDISTGPTSGNGVCGIRRRYVKKKQIIIIITFKAKKQKQKANKAQQSITKKQRRNNKQTRDRTVHEPQHTRQKLCTSPIL